MFKEMYDLPQRSYDVISYKDLQNEVDTWEVKQGRIGFRTPTEGQSFGLLQEHFRAASTQHYISLGHGYRKHPYIMRQVAVCRFLKLVQREETADWIISQSYID